MTVLFIAFYAATKWPNKQLNADLNTRSEYLLHHWWSGQCSSVSDSDWNLLRLEAVQGCVWIWPSSPWTPLRPDCRVSKVSIRQGASGASTQGSHLLLSAPSPVVRQSLIAWNMFWCEGRSPRGGDWTTRTLLCVGSDWGSTSVLIAKCRVTVWVWCQELFLAVTHSFTWFTQQASSHSKLTMSYSATLQTCLCRCSDKCNNPLLFLLLNCIFWGWMQKHSQFQTIIATIDKPFHPHDCMCTINRVILCF